MLYLILFIAVGYFIFKSMANTSGSESSVENKFISSEERTLQSSCYAISKREDYCIKPQNKNDEQFKIDIYHYHPPVRTKNIVTSVIAPYHPNDILVPVINITKGKYELPSGATDSPAPETAVIVAIILYFIQNDAAIGLTKLEQYIIMLDNICFETLDQRLFCYRLLIGPYGYYIRNFRAFLDFIEEKNFITKKKIFFDRKKYKYHFTSLQNINSDLFPEPLKTWLRFVLETWRGVGAAQTKEDIRKKLSPKAVEAFTAMPSIR